MACKSAIFLNDELNSLNMQTSIGMMRPIDMNPVNTNLVLPSSHVCVSWRWCPAMMILKNKRIFTKTSACHIATEKYLWTFVSMRSVNLLTRFIQTVTMDPSKPPWKVNHGSRSQKSWVDWMNVSSHITIWQWVQQANLCDKRLQDYHLSNPPSIWIRIQGMNSFQEENNDATMKTKFRKWSTGSSHKPRTQV